MKKIKKNDRIVIIAGKEIGKTGKVLRVFPKRDKVVVEALRAGDKVSLPGFGTFMVAERAARKGRNPRTGEEIQIPAVKVPKFKIGKNLKEAVRS